MLKDFLNKPDENLKVFLKKDNIKGIGLFANKTIKKCEVIAYYKVTIFRYTDYESPTDGKYSVALYRKNGKEYKRIVGDIDDTSFPDPVEGITFWGPFANEPSQNQKSNADLDIDLKTNYRDRSYLSVGDTYIYKLVAIKNIRKGSEILWYYGKNYSRDYKASKK